MLHGHLTKHAHDEEDDEAADGVGGDNAGTGLLDGGAGAQEEARADARAKSDHLQVARLHAALQAVVCTGVVAGDNVLCPDGIVGCGHVDALHERISMT